MDNFQSIIIHWKFAVVLCLLVLGSEVVGRTADLTLAKKRKKDEFYTQLVDIENELKHYREHFKDKVVLCNCDDPRKSNFFKYFADNFEKLQLKRLIATCYKSQDVDLFSQGDCERAVCQIYEGDKNGNMTVDDDEVCVKELKGDGDFRSEECIEILKQADIVVTNPPFSLFREFMATLIKHEKKFLIIGNVNALKYKEIFPLIMGDKVWLGASIHSGDREFGVPEDYPLEAASCRVDSKGNKYIRVKGVRWYTNLEYSSRHEKLPLYKAYSPEEYPRYVNFDAIEVSKTSDIPIDYEGPMGVPITFMDKYNPDQFEIVGMSLELADMRIIRERLGRNDGGPTFYLERNGKLDRLYDRIVIRHRKPAK